MRELEGKTAFVTGAASGIGLGIARALAGAKVKIALADIEGMYQAAGDVARDFGRVDVLVNNAGVGFVGTPLDEISDQDFDWVIGVNLHGVIHGIKAFVSLIKRHGEGGHVVNTSSIGGFQVKPGWNHGLYAADANHTPATAVAMASGVVTSESLCSSRLGEKMNRNGTMYAVQPKRMARNPAGSLDPRIDRFCIT